MILAMAAAAVVVLAVIVIGMWAGGKALKPKIAAVIAESKERKEEQEKIKEAEQRAEEEKEAENQKEERQDEVAEGEKEEELDGSADETGEDYILPDSNFRYLDRTDLEGLNSEELRLARNEIYARHGRIFEDETLQAYFSSKNWYSGTLTQEEFQDNVFNEYEKQNLIVIKEYENEVNR